MRPPLGLRPPEGLMRAPKVVDFYTAAWPDFTPALTSEAAKAAGMSTSLRFRRILVPQAARYALPGLGNVWQLTLKDTSLISVVGLVEIMRQAFVASGSTKEPFTFFVTAAVLYLALTSLSNKVFDKAEIWANRGVRRA